MAVLLCPLFFVFALFFFSAELPEIPYILLRGHLACQLSNGGGVRLDSPAPCLLHVIPGAGRRLIGCTSRVRPDRSTNWWQPAGARRDTQPDIGFMENKLSKHTRVLNKLSPFLAPHPLFLLASSRRCSRLTRLSPWFFRRGSRWHPLLGDSTRTAPAAASTRRTATTPSPLPSSLPPPLPPQRLISSSRCLPIAP